MNFGDILRQWESGAQSRPVIDKDKIADAQVVHRFRAGKRQLKNMASEATCDLHGLTRDEAHFKLGDFIDECVRKRLKKVLIVHGKGIHSDTLAANGESILAAEVRSFIEADPRLGAFGRAPGKDGGAGATWVIIK